MNTYEYIAGVTRYGLNYDFVNLNRTTNSLLSEVGTYRAGSNPAPGVLANLADADIAAVNQGITQANTSISMSQTAEGAIDQIVAKLRDMRDLAQDVALGGLEEQEIADKDEQYQALAAEVVSLIEDTACDGAAVLSGPDAVVLLDLDDVTGMSLTDLPDGATGMLSAAIVDVGLAQNGLVADRNRLTGVAGQLQTHRENLTSFESRLGGVQDALDVLRSVTAQMTENLLAAVSAETNVSPDRAMYLLT